MSDNMEKIERYVQQLTDCQTRLYAYILMLLPNHDAAADVLQETNLVLWRKAGEFAEGTDFGAWACRIAYYQVLASLRDAKRDRLIFDQQLLDTLGAEAETLSGEFEEHRQSLRLCMKRLAERERALLGRRYDAGWSIKRIAGELGQSPGAVATSLYRIRLDLLDCIQKNLEEGGRP
ncbi:MAG: sigma-70 family RNA polymerase sigma factor [Pirellulaceae bacterium]|nr:sigma-70 family RNA polymerase sigma factor [Pirellulaceae bacterium]